MGEKVGGNHCSKQLNSRIVVRMIPLLTSLEIPEKVTPTFSSFDPRGFNRAINLRDRGKWPCENRWEGHPTYVRNKQIKDLPFRRPKCCRDLFNQMRDKKNARKLKSYYLDKAIRPFVRGMKVEEIATCSNYDIPIVQVPECFIVERDSDSSDEDVPLNERRESECSGCGTLGEGFKRFVKRQEKVDFREILQRVPLDPCEKILGTGKNYAKLFD